MKNIRQKTLTQLGESGLIERIGEKFKAAGPVIRGIGDDAAVISYTRDKYLLFTTDMLVAGVHFPGQGADFFQVGRKALAVNISDIAAMGGIPKYALLTLGLPRKTSLKTIDNIILGISALAKEFKVTVVGGDTVRADQLILNMALLGEVKKERLTLRSGAKAGDMIFVSGTLGNTRKEKQFNFTPRIKQAQAIIKRFRPSAMIDISDGLSCDLSRIAQASKVGAVIFAELIPLAKGADLNSALYAGEDFELLFTTDLARARKFYKAQTSPVSCIGKIVERSKGLTLIDKKARVSRLKEKGFRHF